MRFSTFPRRAFFITQPKTAAGIRTIQLPDFVYQALCEHLEHQGEYQKFMFVTASNKPIHPRFLSTAFERLLKESGLPRIRFHDLRHFAISYLINELKIPASVVQSIVGHASPVLALSVYTHASTQHQQEAMQKMGHDFQESGIIAG